MATLSQNITRAIQDLNDIRDAIINTGIGMPENENVDNYASWIAMMKPDLKLEATIVGGAEGIIIPSEGGSVSINITSNTYWEIDVVTAHPSLSWSQTSGFKNATVTVSAPANHNQKYAIIAAVRCKYDTSIVVMFGGRQDKLEDEISVSPTSISFTNHSGEEEEQINVTSNTDWHCIVSGPFNISRNSGSGNGRITVTRVAYDDADGSVIFTTDYDKKEAVVTISQRQ